MGPKLRFAEFDHKWITLQIGETAQPGGLKTGPFGAQLKAQEYTSDQDGIPVVMPKDIREGKIVVDTIARVPEKKAEKLRNHRLVEGDILFPRRGELGRIGLVSAKQRGWLCGTGCLRLRLNVKANPAFIALSLQRTNSVQWLESNAVGQTMLNLNTNIISDLPIEIPTLPEQRKIADFLSAVDKRIQQLTQKKALLEDYKKGVMQQLFTQAIRFKDDDGNDFPDWEERKLGELTQKTGKKNKENKDLPVYSINNQVGFLPQEDQFDGVNSKDRGFDLTLYKIVDERTFAYNPARINVGSIGYNKEMRNIIVSSLYVCFRTLEPLLDEYLVNYLDTFSFNKAVLRNAEGGVRQYLFYENFSDIKIPLPSSAEQAKIADFLSAIDCKIESVAVQIIETQTFKRSLLQQMFV